MGGPRGTVQTRAQVTPDAETLGSGDGTVCSWGGRPRRDRVHKHPSDQVTPDTETQRRGDGTVCSRGGRPERDRVHKCPGDPRHGG